MKRIFTLLPLVVFSCGVNAQNDVYLKINHMLGANPFSYNMVTSNNQNDSFAIKRLEYYLAEIKLTHDGGQVINLSTKHLMVKADEPVNELLGSFNITNLEAVGFGIGVDQAHNHTDITLYPTGHPLSFQDPSMHWGWAAGYRFAASHGVTYPAAQSWQLHALGDKNYGYASVATTGTANGNDLIIALDADYSKAFDNITVDGNLNYHGEDAEAPVLLQNLQNKVFTVGSADVGISETDIPVFSMAPNPASSSTTLAIGNDDLLHSKVVVVNITGKVVYVEQLTGERTHKMHIPQAGIYIVSLINNGNVAGARKLIIQ